MQTLEVEIQGERRLEGSMFLPTQASAAAMFLSGYRSSRERYNGHAETISKNLNIACLTVDLGGHGNSEGNLRTLNAQSHTDDARMAYDFLLDKSGANPNRVGFAGSSYGAYIGLILCRTRTPKSLLLRAPAILEDLSSNDYERLQQDPASKSEIVESLPQNSVLRDIANFNGPMTIVESGDDSSVVPGGLKACLALAPNARHLVIEGAGHVLQDEERQVYRQMLLDWARQL